MFAIRQKSTGYFMSAFKKNQSKGGTWLEPEPDCTPRLFRRRQDAKVALDNWLRGKLTVTTHYGYFGHDGDSEDRNWEVVPERKAEDMEIIEVEIVVLGDEEDDYDG